MKIFIILALFGFCVRSDTPAEEETKKAALAVNEFSLDILKEVREDGKNTFFSGYSIAVAMGMVSLGAGGNTLTEIDKTMHLENINADDSTTSHKIFKGLMETFNEPNEFYNLSIANRFYGADNFEFKQEFVDDVKSYYDGDLEQVKFDSGTAENIINEWIEEKTNDKLKDMISPKSFDGDTVLVLVNAVYFKANWNIEFKEESTTDEKFFTSLTNEIQVKMMMQIDYFKYHANSDLKVKVLELPYKTTSSVLASDLSMFVILPDVVDGLPVVINSLTATELESLITTVSYQSKVGLKLPKFEFKTNYDLIAPLEKLGINDLFGDNCDLSAIGPGLSVTKVAQSAFVRVDEAGTEAAAVTVVESLSRSGGFEDIVHFHADHPFMVVLRDNRKHVNLFMGIINSPELD